MKKILKFRENEKGEVMIESVIVFPITMLILIWLLALSFLFYQHVVMVTITNDAAAKIANTYNNISSDIVMGYIEAGEISERDLYRSASNTGLVRLNGEKAEKYIGYYLERTNFSGAVKDYDVEFKLVLDSTTRAHVEITTTCEYNNPFGNILELFGLKFGKFQTFAAADCTDLINYLNIIDSKDIIGDKIGSSTSIVKLINKLISVFNHYTS